MMKRTMGGVLAAAMMMSALPAVGAVDVSHLNNTGSSSLSQAASDTLPSLSVAPVAALATSSYCTRKMRSSWTPRPLLRLICLPSRQVRAFMCITMRLSPCLSRHRLPPMLF